MANNIAPRLDQRASIIGMTGSGKTTLARKICEQRPFVVVYDTKRTIRWAGYHRVETLADLMRAGNEYPRLIYAPNHLELPIANREICNQFFQWIYERQNTTLYVDEVYSCCKGTMIPHYYLACLTQGRELGISVISSTQRPKEIPQFILSESECYYVFRLQMLPDKKKIEDTVGITVANINALRHHEFMYASSEGDILGPIRLRLT